MTIHATRLILGVGKNGSYFRTPVVTAGREQRNCDRMGPGGGGLASTVKPRLRLRPSLPLVLVTVPVVGGSLGVNTTTRQQTTLTSKNVGKFSLPR